ncbi:hypothetical protein [Thermogemmatispora onikobensis]|uniref:hypothetical protein n=1 Tax=Thermogemmatispora onikobensis TaxID=732234 RepID=UPI00114CF906|nr:hypothetical protein [Thermogemmatispora onikobensis]
MVSFSPHWVVDSTNSGSSRGSSTRSGAALPLAPGSSAASIGACLSLPPTAELAPISSQTSKRAGEDAALD